MYLYSLNTYRNPDYERDLTSYAPAMSDCYRSMTLTTFPGSSRELKLVTDPEINIISKCQNGIETYTYIEACKCNIIQTKNIQSYYGSVKLENKNQYGTIYDINWIGVNNCGTNCIDSNVYFGGDTFIGRFSVKRKHSFFERDTYQLSSEYPINYSFYGNAAYPAFYFDTNPIKKYTVLQSLGINFDLNETISSVDIKSLIPFFKNSIFDNKRYLNPPKYNFDCNPEDTGNVIEEDGRLLSFNAVKGIMYLYSYGISYFIAESDVNLDLRGIDETKQSDFYPRESNLQEWLQKRNLDPVVQNEYVYDKSYSRQFIEEFHYQYGLDFKGNEFCENTKYNRVIASAQGTDLDDDDLTDSLLNFKALDFNDFSLSDGKLISIEGAENGNVLARQENVMSLFKANTTIQSDRGLISLSNGTGIGIQNAQHFTKPDLGYAGSQHKAILHTQFGHVSVDAKRGYVFLLGNNFNSLDEISNNGMKHWFKENLPFTISKQFPDYNIDNALNGAGLSMCFDMRFNSFYLTKKDYEANDKVILIDGKFYDKITNLEVSLTDSNYFCDKSWTISYNFNIEQWTSFHSFIPDGYIEHVDHFDTVKNNSIWKHNITNKDYQRYYGKLYPFIVEVQSKYDSVNHILNNVSFITEVNQYFNNYDLVRLIDKSFNKAIVYNSTQNSGLLNLEITNNNLYQKSKYPIVKSNIESIISLVIKENYHNFNQFKDKVNVHNIPIWLYECNNIDKKLNPDVFLNKSRENIRDFQNKVMLIQDKEHQYHYIFKYLIFNDTKTHRL